MSAFFIVLMLLVMFLMHELAELALLVHFPEIGRKLVDFEKPLGSVAPWMLLALPTSWLLFIGLCLAGSSRELPLLTRLARRPWIVRLAFGLNSMGLILLALFPALAVHANSLTSTNRDDAAVYVLYDDSIPVPRWAWAVGFYRIALQAQRKWGEDSTVLERLNRENLRTALANGKVLVFATHGSEGFIFANNFKLCIGPQVVGAADDLNTPHYLGICTLAADKKWSPWEKLETDRQLQLVYVAGCDSGKKASQWAEHLSPARVITFNRLSSLIEHAFWAVNTLPSELKQLR